MSKEILKKTRDEKMGIMARRWIHNRFGVDETPVVDQKPTRKSPEAVLFHATTNEASWAYNRFGVDER